MKTCPQCKEGVQTDALVCRHCHHRFTEGEMTAGRRESGRTRIFQLVLAGIVLAAAVSCLQNGGAERMGEYFGSQASRSDGGN